MKKIKYLLITVIGLSFLYVVISYLMIIIWCNGNGNFIERHYFKYKSIDDARNKKGLLNENSPFKLVDFKPEQEKLIRENIFVYTTKSNYQTFYGFWFNIKNEDKEMVRVEIHANKDIKSLPDFLINKKLSYKDNLSTLTSRSINLYKKEKSVILDVIEYQNHKPIKLGKIIIEL